VRPVAVALVIATMVSSAESPPDKSCATVHHHDFDFVIGNWLVRDSSGQAIGTVTVAKGYGGRGGGAVADVDRRRALVAGQVLRSAPPDIGVGNGVAFKLQRKGRTMKIVIIGGTGLIGSKVVDQLREHGHEAIPASPDTGVNTLTGEGLAAVITGADVIIDVSNSPSFEDAAVLDFFKTSTSNILAAEKKAGVRHHVALSVVGTERMGESGYIRAKQAQEQLIRESGTPYSIVRATQFFEFVPRIADALTVGTEVRVPPVLFQPIAAEDVAKTVGKISVGTPLNGILEVGGPQQFRFDEIIRRALAARKDPREVIADPKARYFGAVLSERTLVPDEGTRVGEVTLEMYLKQKAAAAAQPAAAGR
jgi:uncharacterized protein YbjT (DUF2867 family)